MKEQIYVASPLGFSEVGRKFMYDSLIPEVENAGFNVLDPWKLTPEEDVLKVINLPYGQEKRQAWQKLNKIIGENNAKAIEAAKGVFAVLDGTDVDSGTAAEIGYASALGKPSVGYRGDFRLAADNEGSLVNLQVEYFIHQNGGKIVTAVADVRKALIEVFG